MTNKEAIIELRDLEDYCNSTFLKRTCKAYTQAINKGIEALENQKSIIKELKKIKEEVEELGSLRDNPYNNETEYSVSTEELRELFDKHIAELKGE